MVDLNNLCLLIQLGDNRAANEFLNEKAIRLTIGGAVKKIVSRNTNYDFKQLYALAQTELWDQILNNYKPPEDMKKSNNLVLRYVKTVVYDRLLNHIRDDKGLRWSKKGFKHKIVTVPIDVPYSHGSDDEVKLIDAVPDDNPTDSYSIASNRKYLLRKALNKLVNNGKMPVSCNYIILLRFYKDMSHSEIQEYLYNTLGKECSLSWISTQIKMGLELLAEELEDCNII